ncbi:DUF294 nucleotidyltransferase-like domain-containing protein [Paenibacillus thermotolerans]|uniref:DUF294 nucleotidyltransferase-like domain-containing protein n=1 Tax=Paenibacillus thermotolerans TaxID=3027807 RepID=UPI002367DCD9|nr:MULTISPECIES: DUF294 nucleotidyltransferase-like domain-containing protein [unclassified Paenibacillus]
MVEGWNGLERQIRSAESAERLRQLRDDFHRLAGAFPLTADPASATELINRMHDTIIGRAIELADQSAGAPSAAYAVLLLGSGGRREQMLSSDQDHCIVYEPYPQASPEEVSAYASALGLQIRSCLERVGYPPCDGDVLGSNPLWRNDLPGWERVIKHWASVRDFESVRRLLITADARPIAGETSLAERFHNIRDMAIQQNEESLLPRMLENTLRHKMLIGVFGHLLTERYGVDSGGIDIKYGAYIPMVNGIRLLSLAERVRASSTLDRIRLLEQREAVPAEMAAHWREAFHIILELRSMIPSYEVQGLYANRGKLPAHLLTKDIKTKLKHALRVGGELQGYVKRVFVSGGLL